MDYHNLKKVYVSKIVLLGNDNVGKTSLCLKFIKNVFKKNVESTIGVNFYTKYLNYHGKEYKLVLWDTSGHERFRCILRNYYKLANLFILMFDLGNIKSFESLPYWLDQIEINNPVKKNKILVIANKSDNDRQISDDAIKIFSDKYKLPVFTISIKENFNLSKMEEFMYSNIEIKDNNEEKKIIKKNKKEEQQLCFNLCIIL